MAQMWRRQVASRRDAFAVAKRVGGQSREISALGVWRLLRFAAATVEQISICLAEARKGRVEPERSAQYMQAWSATVLQRLGVEVHLSGTPPPPGALIVANHRSYIDIAVIAAQTPCTFLAKAEVARWPVLGYGAKRFANIVFVQRNSLASRSQSMAKMRSILGAGVSVALFPEGTTSRGPGILPFRPGMFRLAAREGIPVVPVAIEYGDASDAWVDQDTFIGHFLRTFSKPRVAVKVCFGPVLRGMEAGALQNVAWHWINTVVQEERRVKLHNAAGAERERA